MIFEGVLINIQSTMWVCCPLRLPTWIRPWWNTFYIFYTNVSISKSPTEWHVQTHIYIYPQVVYIYIYIYEISHMDHTHQHYMCHSNTKVYILYIYLFCTQHKPWDFYARKARPKLQSKQQGRAFSSSSSYKTNGFLAHFFWSQST